MYLQVASHKSQSMWIQEYSHNPKLAELFIDFCSQLFWLLCSYVFILIVLQWNGYNTELAIYALEQVHCWGTYFRARTGQFENFTHLNF
jgi:hypothetical protein